MCFLAGVLLLGVAEAAPYTPASDDQVLAVLPAGARHTSAPNMEITRSRLDIALPLAQFYISRSRATGDLRFLGYAEAMLTPWMKQVPVPSQVLVLHATILQSRHSFTAALAELDQALGQHADDPQAWLTRATVLRVLGRYDEALTSCQKLAVAADPAVTALCMQGVMGLDGHLQSAYAAIVSLPQQALPPEARAWRYSELGEMAERLGDDTAAEHWLREGLQLAPEDFYMRSACADVLLRHGRAAETVRLLTGYESMEPMLLRLAIAQRMLKDSSGSKAVAQLAGAFDIEQQRGDAVHRREQARFLLDVDPHPAEALAAAESNWQVQREPEDVLVLLRAAQAAHQPQAAEPARQFLKLHGLEDARLNDYLRSNG
ncbi:MAG: tetratricopeptide repeat protein [Steroidobacteraceae bacterium]|jgi:tetratricopeptide (TPR) repeat protein